MTSIDDVLDISPMTQFTASAAQTEFDYPFPITADEDIVVYDNDALQVLGTDYTVTGEGNDNGGTVIFVTGRTDGHTITLYRDIPIERTSDFQQNGPYASATVNDELDKITMVMQQLEARIGRSLRLSLRNPQASTELEIDAAFNGTYLFINADGELEPAASIATTTLSQSIIGALVNPRTDAEQAAGVTPSNYAVPNHEAVGTIHSARYDLLPSSNGATNRAAIAAINGVASQLGGAVSKIGSGLFAVDATLTCDVNNHVIEGSGKSSTRIQFDPATTDVLFDLTKGGSSIVRAGVRNMGFYSTNTETKTAIRVNDGRQCVVDTIGINQGSWPGDGSIGINTLGRDFWNIKNCDIECARPLVISNNPNFPTINLDVSVIENTQFYTPLSTGSCVEVENGVELSSMRFDTVDFAGGKYAFRRVDSTSTLSSFGLSFVNCRTEQMVDATGFSIYIDQSGSQKLQDLLVDSFVFAPEAGGIYLRGVERVTLRNSLFVGGTGITNLDITFGPGTVLKLDNTHIQVGSTVTLTNAVLVEAGPWNPAETALPKTAMYRYDEGAVISQRPALGYNGIKRWSYQGTLANNTILSTPFTRSAYSTATISVTAYSATGPIHCTGTAGWTKNGAMTKHGGSANFVVAAVGTELRVLDGGSGLVVLNALGQTVTLSIDIVGI